jgi:ABC-type dipeptide/oligopeptide/nickel transport system ATPase component
MNPIHATAIAFAEAGVSVVPAAMDGSKAPLGAWKKYQLTHADREQLDAWFSGNATGLGIITGKVSGNLEMVELEGRAVAEGLLDEAREIAENSGLGELWKIISNGYVELTPSGGLHWLWRIADEPVPGNTKLARRIGENDSVLVYAETRGEGGFVITAPSHGTVHPSGQPWQILVGSPATIPMLSWEEREAIVSVFRSIDSMPHKDQVVQNLSQNVQNATGEKPGDDFNAKAQWSEILIGWKQIFTVNGVTYWRRPGKDVGISATTGRNDGDNLYVFTTSSSFEAEKPYSKFAAFAHLHHGDDFSAAARDLRSKGYGSQKPSSSSLPSLGELMAPTPILTVVPDIDADHVEPAKERSSWYPRPLDLNGDREEPAPEFLSRNDGHRLFYKGKINGLLGESESGKTWVALLAVKQALEIEQKVIYLDFEDSGKGILARLRSLGVEDHRFQTFTYANPDQNLTLDERIDLVDALMEIQPDLIVVDGVNAAMTLLGLDLTSNRDATFFSQQLLKPLALSGACVITIDHVPKSKDNRGNYAIGAQAKRADINGCAIAVEVVQPFGKGMNGELLLKVTKDRPGAVREHSKEAKFAGRVLLNSSQEGMVKMMIESPQMPTGERTRPTHLMESVSKILESAMTPLSKSAVIKEVKGKTEWVMIAIQNLIDEKFVGIENGSRNALNLKSLRPYRQIDDSSSGISSFNWVDAENA